MIGDVVDVMTLVLSIDCTWHDGHRIIIIIIIANSWEMRV